MNNKYKLQIYDSEKDTNFSFSRGKMSVLVREDEFNSMMEEYKLSELEPLFVKIESKVPLKNFTIYASISPLLGNIYEEETIYVEKDLFHKDFIVNSGLSVTVEYVDMSSIREAEVVTIKLDKDLVGNWSEDEAKFASNTFRTNNKLVYTSQMTYLKPMTKKNVLGEVIDIIPKSKNRFEPFHCTSKTKIILEGLPEDKQKVIDFSKIGGLGHIINNLREIIQVPLTYPNLLEKFDIKPPKGMLMYGPPGNGKTMIAKAVSYSLGSKFISIQGPEFMSKYVGVAEEQLREKFEEAEKLGNCVIFIDEIDSVASKRDDSSAEWQISFVSTLLNLMDGMRSNSRVFVIGATNRLHAIDPALRRPGRFDLEFEVPLPITSARQDILSKYIDPSKQELFADDVNNELLQVLSELTNGYSGADLSLLYRESVMSAIRKNMQIDNTTGKIALKIKEEDVKIEKKDFFDSMKNITPTSLRGIDIQKSTKHWEDIIGLDKQKGELKEIHNAIELLSEVDNIEYRLSLLNILLLGNKGSGRRTLMHAFATKYNYEILYLDMLNISSISLKDAFVEIEEIFTKAKQIAPVIITILNIDKIQDNEVLVYKLINEIERLNKRHKIIVCAKIENKKHIHNSLLGYKAFEYIIDFNNIDKDAACTDLKERYGISINQNMLQSNTIGRILTKRNEEQLIKLHNN